MGDTYRSCLQCGFVSYQPAVSKDQHWLATASPAAPTRPNEAGSATIPRMPESGSEVRYHLTGEVSERAELLNGSMQLALDGVASHATERWELAVALAWRIGREGAIPLEEGDLAFDHGDVDNSELVAILDGGSAEEDSDTGNAIVEARFTIEESNITAFEAGTQLHCRFEVSTERWTGVMSAAVNEN